MNSTTPGKAKLPKITVKEAMTAKRNSQVVVLFSVFFVSILLLTAGFVNNQWGVVDQAWFQSYKLDVEGNVVGRLAKSQQDGLFSGGGLTGYASKLDDYDSVDSQYVIYLNSLPVENFYTYNSQIGFQAMFFGFLDQMTDFSNSQNLQMFRVLSAVLAAVFFAIVIVWFTEQFGLVTGIFVLIVTLLSQWLVLFSRNLWWALWAFYLPMLASLGILYYEDKTKKFSTGFAVMTISCAVFMKCLFNGYEYITTTLIMMLTPFVYYALCNKWPLRRFCLRAVVVGIGSVVATATSMLILVFQISSINGDGLQHILYSFGKRTYGNPVYYPAKYHDSYEANPLYVLLLYLRSAWLNLNHLITVDLSLLSYVDLKITFATIIMLFLLLTAVGIFAVQEYPLETDIYQDKLKALIGATWFSISAPISWFFIFKSHSYVHQAMNEITWHMPFTFFGFALVGFVLKLLIVDVWYLHKKGAPMAG